MVTTSEVRAAALGAGVWLVLAGAGCDGAAGDDAAVGGDAAVDAGGDGGGPDAGAADAGEACRRVFVDDDAGGDGDGRSWDEPLGDLQAALDLDAPCLEVRVAGGRYVPSALRDGVDPRSASFVVHGDVTITGGYPDAASGSDVRDVDAYETVLHGDLDGDDGDEPTDETLDDNARTVIDATEASRIRLDGVVVTGAHGDDGTGRGTALEATGETRLECRRSRIVGNRATGLGTAVRVSGETVLDECVFGGNVTTGASAGRAHGASCLVTEGPVTIEGTTFVDNETSGAAGVGYLSGAPIVIRDSEVAGNRAEGSGGAFWIASAHLRIEGSRFDGNMGDQGGALLLIGTTATIVRTDFIDNESRNGGAIMTGTPLDDSELLVTHSRFLGNTAGRGGGLQASNQRVTVAHCLFSGNEASTAGAIALRQSRGGPDLIARVVSSTIVGNAATGRWGGVVVEHRVRDEGAELDVAFHNDVLWGNTQMWGTPEQSQLGYWSWVEGAEPFVDGNLIQDWTGGGDNVTDDPMLVDADGPDGEAGTEDDAPRPAEGSPCIDAGDNARVPADRSDVDGDGDTDERVPRDLGGAARFVDDPGEDTGTGDPPLVDLGAYEAGG